VWLRFSSRDHTACTAHHTLVLNLEP
jgi:hypothetical protein